MTTIRQSKELIHEGKYAAELPIELHYSDESWLPTMSLDDAKSLKLSASRCAAATLPKHPNTAACSN
jgi:hypothetical protein